MKKCLMMTFIILLTVSCKSGGGDNVTSDSGSSSSNIDGVYTGCENDTENGMSMSSTMSLSGGGGNEDMIIFDGLNCNDMDATEKISVQYNVTKGSNYKFMVVGATSTILDSSYVSVANTYNYCGFTGSTWALNVPRNILGRDCSGIEYTYGEAINAVAKVSGGKLTLSSGGNKFVYTSINATNFSNSAQTFEDGSYSFFNGAAGFYITFDGSNYIATMYNANTSKRYSETGSYTTVGNQIEFTPATISDGCGSPEDYDPNTSYFSMTSVSLALKDSDNNVIIFSKAPYTKTQFETAFLRTTYTAGCF